MTFTLRESSSAVTALARASVPAADPWDAPYFGGPIYFRYPAFPVAVAALTCPAAQLDVMPAAPSVAPTPAPDSLISPAPSAPPVALETSGPPAAIPATASIQASTPRRRGWLARLFRAG
jgi:hypothetical protein